MRANIAESALDRPVSTVGMCIGDALLECAANPPVSVPQPRKSANGSQLQEEKGPMWGRETDLYFL